jgi:hypothetical protein
MDPEQSQGSHLIDPAKREGTFIKMLHNHRHAAFLYKPPDPVTEIDLLLSEEGLNVKKVRSQVISHDPPLSIPVVSNLRSFNHEAWGAAPRADANPPKVQRLWGKQVFPQQKESIS